MESREQRERLMEVSDSMRLVLETINNNEDGIVEGMDEGSYFAMKGILKDCLKKVNKSIDLEFRKF